MKTLLLTLACVLCIASPALALPALQLDIEGGQYDQVGESVVTASGDFRLYAILTEKNQASIQGTYYISIAINPRIETEASLGSFSFAGVDIDVTDDMTFGTAPIDEALQGWDGGDLPQHDAFPTYFYEYGFTFDPTMTTSSYNVANDPDDPTDDGDTYMPGGIAGGGLVPGGTGSYYMYFDVASADLDGYFLHFDLYNTQILTSRRSGAVDVDSDLFAPFSHDAEQKTVPEPNSLLLLGIGMVGLVGLRRRLG